jgi:tetraacyldisaccharide 4'-kinase
MLHALLRSISPIWTYFAARRQKRSKPQQFPVPILCVGGVTMGGTGKTPVARELIRRLQARGVEAHALSRGYGGKLKGPVRVDPGLHDTTAVGDEPLLLARDAPAWVARDRAAGAAAAVAAGAKAIVLDDGHQNPSIRKSLSLVVVDGETRNDEWPFGDGEVFPAGPMREPLAAGLARADAVVLMLPADLETPDPELMALFGETPVLVARLTPREPPPPGRRIGFAGVAKPWKVERALIAAGCDLVDFAPFPDHAEFAEADLMFLQQRGETLGAGLVTTEKDWVRLSPAWRAKVPAWPVAAVFEDEAAVEALLDKALRPS